MGRVDGGIGRVFQSRQDLVPFSFNVSLSVPEVSSDEFMRKSKKRVVLSSLSQPGQVLRDQCPTYQENVTVWVDLGG